MTGPADRRTYDADHIAITGMAGLFPMATDHRAFWQNIVDARDCTSEVPDTHWRPADYYDPEPACGVEHPDTTYCTRGGFVPPVQFSPGEFGIPPNQLELTTSVQLLSLVVARDLLRDAGAVTSGTAGRHRDGRADGRAAWYDPARTGVTLGVTGPMPSTHPMAARLETPVLKEVVRSCGLSDADAEAIAAKYLLAFPPWEENTFPGLLGNVVAGRIANRLDLGGINCAVDAACASSLSALRLACSELHEGRADLMITGGCDTENTIFGYMCFSRTQALSRGGRIRPFDDGADGTLVGEGIGLLALKRLADARRDGDRVYAVIRGVGSSSDGRFGSIYAPRASGQVLALQRAYVDADCAPTSVGLFEGHATGTAVGDRTELTALAAVLDGGAPAAIGSVKSQIGHTKGAAGTASLMKLALGLHQKVLPPTINVETPNAALANGPLHLNTRTRPWITDPARPARRAAASAMGFGGTNFHVVLEEAGTARPARLHRGPRAHVWHAPDPAALRALLESGAEPADGPVPADHARVGFVSRTDAEAAELRVLAAGLVGPDAVEAPGGVSYRPAARPDLKVAALFAGQGSQYVDMGARAACDFAPVGAAFDAAAAGFPADGPGLAAVVFPPPVVGPDTGAEAREELLRRTEHAQPAIGALSAGQYRVLTDLGLAPAAFLGHSFGELTALWASGALAEADFVRLARTRGLAMAPPADAGYDAGAMAAVTAGRAAVEVVLAAHPGVTVCNDNAPDQVVIGGPTAAVEAATAALTAGGVTVRPLPVAAAFHTAAVGHAVDLMRTALADVEIGRPAGRLVANTAGAAYGDDVAANREVLAEQLRRPVEFAAGLRELADDGVTVFVEFGPRQVLTGLVRRTLGDGVAAIATDAGPSGDSSVALLAAAVRLAVLGVPLHGFDRHAATPFEPVPPSGMTVTLTGMTHRPAARRDAYEAALRDGHRVALPVPPAPAPPPPVPTAARYTNGVARSAAPANGETMAHDPAGRPAPTTPATGPAGSPAAPAAERHSPAAAHAALHESFLGSQLRIAEELVDVLRSNAGDTSVRATVTAVADAAVAISRSHTRAGEVLAGLARLEAGIVAPQRPGPGPVRALPGPAGGTGNGSHPAHVPGPGSSDIETFAAATTLADADALADADTDAFADAFAPAAPAPPAPAAPAGPDAAVVRSALLAVVAEKTGYPESMVDPGMDLEADLGIDSIKRVQILGAVAERVAGLPQVGPEQLAELRSVDDLVGVLAAPVPGAPVPAADAPVPVSAPPRRSEIRMVPLPAPQRIVDAWAAEPAVLLVTVGAPAPDVLTAALAGRGWAVRPVVLPVAADLATWDGERTAAAVAAAAGERLDAAVLVLDGAAGAAHGMLADAVLVAAGTAAALGATAATGSRAAFLTATRLDGALGHLGTAGVPAAALGGVTGLVKTVAREQPGVFARALDVHPALDAAAFTDVLLAELDDAALTPEVGVDELRRRCTPALVDVGPLGGPAGSGPGPGDVLLVTGGARGVTAECVRAVAASGAELLLLGRTPFEETDPEWAVGVPDDGLRAALLADGSAGTPRAVEAGVGAVLAAREVRSTLAALGERARYVVADVTDTAAVRAALGPAAGRVTALVHGAGALADAALPDKTPAAVRRVLTPKLAGLSAVLDVLDGPPSRVVLFGSVAGVLGNPGQADYAAANEALDRVAAALAVDGIAATCIHWGAWDGGMVTPALREVFRSRGVALLDPQVGAAAFAEQWGRAERSVLVGPSGPLAPARPAPAPAITVRRDLFGLAGAPLLRDHRVGADVVLPLAAVLGWVQRTAEDAHRDLVAVGCRDLEVHRGIVLDGAQPAELTLRLDAGTPDGDGLAVRAVVHSQDAAGRLQPHYALTVRLAAAPAPAPVEQASWPGLGAGPEDGAGIYADADLFHGPLLQGLRRILQRTPTRLVVECRLPATPLADGGWASRLTDPATGDVVLQAACVLGVWYLDAGCLPLGVASVDLYAPLPDGEPFVVVVDDLRPGRGGVTVTATAHAVDGRVLQRWTGVSAIGTPDLAARFAESVAARTAEVTR